MARLTGCFVFGLCLQRARYGPTPTLFPIPEVNRSELEDSHPFKKSKHLCPLPGKPFKKSTEPCDLWLVQHSVQILNVQPLPLKVGQGSTPTPTPVTSGPRVAAGRFETRVSPSPAEPELRSEERRLQNNSAPPPARSQDIAGWLVCLVDRQMAVFSVLPELSSAFFVLFLNSGRKGNSLKEGSLKMVDFEFWLALFIRLALVLSCGRCFTMN